MLQRTPRSSSPRVVRPSLTLAMLVLPTVLFLAATAPTVAAGTSCTTTDTTSWTCTFSCNPGDKVYAWANDTVMDGSGWPSIIGTCGGQTAECQANNRCSAVSSGTTTSGTGTCELRTSRTTGTCRAAGGAVPKECTVADPASWSCQFACASGDKIYAWANDTVMDGSGWPSIIGTCGGQTAECQANNRCSAVSSGTAAVGTGTCDLRTSRTTGKCLAAGATTAPPPGAKECSVTALSTSCSFSCSAGEKVYVWANDTIQDGTGWPSIKGECSVAIAQCQANNRCSAVSTSSATSAATGTCALLTSRTTGKCRAASVSSTPIVQPPAAPQTVLTTDVGPGKVQLDWSLPSSDGGSPILYYNVYGGTWSANTYLGRTIGTERTYTDVNLDPGRRTYVVRTVNAAGESGLSPTATFNAYWVYSVEMRAFIPQAKVVDPEFLMWFSSDEAWYESAKSFDGGVCHAPDRPGGPTFVPIQNSKTHASFRGDNHASYDGSYRVRSTLTFRWDGFTVHQSGGPDPNPLVGVTHRDRRYVSSVQDVTCANQEGVGTGSYASILDADTFKLSYSSKNPLVSTSPPIVGHVEGSFDASNVLTLTYDSSQFPSQAMRVNVNRGAGSTPQLTLFSTDASCLSQSQVMGWSGFFNIKDGLESMQGTAQYNLAPRAANASPQPRLSGQC